MNFKQLEVFRTIMSTGSTSAAAIALGQSQSAISRQLTSLEDEIGLELFLRDKGRLTPRREAFLLIRHVDDISYGMSRLQSKITETKTGVAAEAFVRVAVPHSLANSMLPPLVSRFQQANPSVTVEILSGPYDAIEQMVRGRVADFGFVRLPAEDQSFDSRPLVASGTTCVMPGDHPLAAKAAISMADLADRDLILLGRQRINRNELEHRLRRIVPTYRCRLEVHSVETACACAAQGLGIAIVPTIIARFFRSDAVVMRPFEAEIQAQFGIISLPGTPMFWATEALIKEVETEVAGWNDTDIRPLV